jgi:GT2 family glycosyltransferase
MRTRDETNDFIAKTERKRAQVEGKTRTLDPPSPFGRTLKDIHRRAGHIVLHGAIFIVSPDFIRDFEDMFDERTFLYGEEDILALRAISRGHTLLYSPSLRVYHHTKSSTDRKNLERYYLFRYSSSVESARIYLSILNEVEKK